MEKSQDPWTKLTYQNMSESNSSIHNLTKIWPYHHSSLPTSSFFPNGCNNMFPQNSIQTLPNFQLYSPLNTNFYTQILITSSFLLLSSNERPKKTSACNFQSHCIPSSSWLDNTLRYFELTEMKLYRIKSFIFI